MLCPRTGRYMFETALIAPTDSRVSRTSNAGRRGVVQVLVYLVGVKWGRVNCAVLCACMRVCVCARASLLRACVARSHIAPRAVDGTSGVLVPLYLALSLPGVCAVRAVERCHLFTHNGGEPVAHYRCLCIRT